MSADVCTRPSCGSVGTCLTSSSGNSWLQCDSKIAQQDYLRPPEQKLFLGQVSQGLRCVTSSAPRETTTSRTQHFAKQAGFENHFSSHTRSSQTIVIKVSSASGAVFTRLNCVGVVLGQRVKVGTFDNKRT